MQNALRAPSFAEVLPNPSLERTPAGKPRWPRSGVAHHPLRGQRVSPARAPQLKR
jgi:hypothetical protein